MLLNTDIKSYMRMHQSKNITKEEGDNEYTL